MDFDDDQENLETHGFLVEFKKRHSQKVPSKYWAYPRYHENLGLLVLRMVLYAEESSNELDNQNPTSNFLNLNKVDDQLDFGQMYLSDGGDSV